MFRRYVKRGILALVALLLVIQLVPYGRSHPNPPITAEPAWDSAETRDLAQRACFDCHSNQTDWPWYSHVAPVSWLIERDVVEGREKLNFSEWNRPQESAHESAEAVNEGEMPMYAYTVMHGHARLSPQQRDRLVAGLTQTFGSDRGRGDDEAEEHGR